jgi:hypothetical protein
LTFGFRICGVDIGFLGFFSGVVKNLINVDCLAQLEPKLELVELALVALELERFQLEPREQLD